MDSQQPDYEAQLGARLGWKPPKDLDALRRVDPEGYQMVMKGKMDLQEKRQEATVDALYKIDDVFSDFPEVETYLDKEYLEKLYLDLAAIRPRIRPDVTVADMKRFLHAMAKKHEAKFEELDREEWEWERKLMDARAGLDRWSGHLDPKCKAIAEEINKVRRVKDDQRENLRRLDALIKAFDDAALDDGPLERLVEHSHTSVERMEERKRERKGEH